MSHQGYTSTLRRAVEEGDLGVPPFERAGVMHGGSGNPIVEVGNLLFSQTFTGRRNTLKDVVVVFGNPEDIGLSEWNVPFAVDTDKS